MWFTLMPLFIGPGTIDAARARLESAIVTAGAAAPCGAIVARRVVTGRWAQELRRNDEGQSTLKGQSPDVIMLSLLT